MCIINRKAHVEKTQIFVSPSANQKRQLTVYSNKLTNLAENNAMILPVPNIASLKFHDMTNYKTFFDDCKNAFKELNPILSRGAVSKGVKKGKMLDIVDIGSYRCSLVPTLDDFDRLDGDVFKLHPQTRSVLSRYYARGTIQKGKDASDIDGSNSDDSDASSSDKDDLSGNDDNFLSDDGIVPDPTLALSRDQTINFGFLVCKLKDDTYSRSDKKRLKANGSKYYEPLAYSHDMVPVKTFGLTASAISSGNKTLTASAVVGTDNKAVTQSPPSYKYQELFVPTRHHHGSDEEETLSAYDHEIYSFNTVESCQTITWKHRQTRGLKTNLVDFDFPVMWSFRKTKLNDKDNNTDLWFVVETPLLPEVESALMPVDSKSTNSTLNVPVNNHLRICHGIDGSIFTSNSCNFQIKNHGLVWSIPFFADKPLFRGSQRRGKFVMGSQAIADLYKKTGVTSGATAKDSKSEFNNAKDSGSDSDVEPDFSHSTFRLCRFGSSNNSHFDFKLVDGGTNVIVTNNGLGSNSGSKDFEICSWKRNIGFVESLMFTYNVTLLPIPADAPASTSASASASASASTSTSKATKSNN